MPRRTLAVILAGVTGAAAIALPLIAASIWLFWGELAPYAAGQIGRPFDLAGIGPGARFAGLALSLTGALLQAFGLLGLRATFLEAAEGRALSARAIDGFRRFARVALIMVFFTIAERTGLVLIFSIADPEAPRTLAIEAGTPEIKSLFMALLLVFVAHVFAVAKRAKDENDAFL